MGQHRRFAEEYRRGAARIVIDTGQTVKAEAGQLGLDEQIFGKWVAKERARRIAVESGQPAPDDYPSEIARLRRHVADLKAENEFLGKAGACFAGVFGKAGACFAAKRQDRNDLWASPICDFSLAAANAALSNKAERHASYFLNGPTAQDIQVIDAVAGLLNTAG